MIVAGGRNFNDYNYLKKSLDFLLQNIKDKIIIICGTARGADTLGEKYAKEYGYEVSYFPAKWKIYGRKAGYIRNEKMAQEADALVAFWDGNSHGTKNMIEIAEKYNLLVRVRYY